MTAYVDVEGTVLQSERGAEAWFCPAVASARLSSDHIFSPPCVSVAAAAAASDAVNYSMQPAHIASKALLGESATLKSLRVLIVESF